MKLFVISLADAEERRRHFVQQAKSSVVAWQFFDAHTKLNKSLSYREENALLLGGRALTPGELGCYSSHYLSLGTALVGRKFRALRYYLKRMMPL